MTKERNNYCPICGHLAIPEGARKVLHAIRDAEGPVSVPVLCKQLELSAVEVWRAIRHKGLIGVVRQVPESKDPMLFELAP